MENKRKKLEFDLHLLDDSIDVLTKVLETAGYTLLSCVSGMGATYTITVKETCKYKRDKRKFVKRLSKVTGLKFVKSNLKPPVFYTNCSGFFIFVETEYYKGYNFQLRVINTNESDHLPPMIYIGEIDVVNGK